MIRSINSLFYGIELDWRREIFCFGIGGEYDGIEIINQFTRDVKAITKAAAAKRGHEIKLAVRVPASPEAAYYSGFDVVKWAREGLIDLVTAAPRWQTSDCDIPVELWKRILPESVEFAAGAEILLNETESYDKTFNSVDTATALAAQYFSAGADKFYLFNYMFITSICS